MANKNLHKPQGNPILKLSNKGLSFCRLYLFSSPKHTLKGLKSALFVNRNRQILLRKSHCSHRLSNEQHETSNDDTNDDPFDFCGNFKIFHSLESEAQQRDFASKANTLNMYIC